MNDYTEEPPPDFQEAALRGSQAWSADTSIDSKETAALQWLSPLSGYAALDDRVRRNLDAIAVGFNNAFPFTLFRDIDPMLRKTWLIDDMLGHGELSIFYGAPGCGKSVLVGDAACHVAAGRAWHGRATSQAGVLYIAAERATLVKRRLAAWRRFHGEKDIPVGVIQGRFDLCFSDADAMRIGQTAKVFTQQTGHQVEWIIIDTVAQVLAGGDENSGMDVGRLVANLSLIQEKTKAHVTALHHVPHGEQTRMRGHGALLGAADATFRIEHNKEISVRTMAIDKVNDGPDDIKIAFTLESVELSEDGDTGKITTAPVVVAADMHGHDCGGDNVRLTNAEELAHRILVDAIAEIGRPLPSSWKLPPALCGIGENEWRSRCYDGQIADSDNPASKQKAFKRAADGLQRKRKIGVRETIIWAS